VVLTGQDLGGTYVYTGDDNNHGQVTPDPPPALRTEAQEAAFGQGGKRLGAEAWPRHVEHPAAQPDAAHTRDPKPNPRVGGGSGVTVDSAQDRYTGTIWEPQQAPQDYAGSLTRDQPWAGWLQATDDGGETTNLLVLPGDGVFFNTSFTDNSWLDIGGRL